MAEVQHGSWRSFSTRVPARYRFLCLGLVVVIAGFGIVVVSLNVALALRPTWHVSCLDARSFTHVPARPIVAFGDSITWGWNASRDCVPPDASDPSSHIPGVHDTSYPAGLERLLGRPVLDYGLPGEQTSAGLARLRSVLRDTHPSVVLLMEGVNDLIHGGGGGGVIRRLSTMIADIRRAGASPVLLTLTPAYYPHGNPRFRVDGQIRQVNRALRALNRSRGVSLIDVGNVFVHDPRSARLMCSRDGHQDYLHPNDAGYRLIARTIAPFLGTGHA